MPGRPLSEIRRLNNEDMGYETDDVETENIREGPFDEGNICMDDTVDLIL